MYKLICGKDASQIGIEAENGSWNMRNFYIHVQKCSQCADYKEKMKNLLLYELTQTGISFLKEKLKSKIKS